MQDLRLAHEYRNKLIEIERARRARVRLAEDALLGEPRRKLSETEKTLEDAVEAVAKYRASTRKRAAPEELIELLKLARSSHHEASYAFRVARQRVQPLCAACKKKELPTPCEHATPEGRQLLVELDAAKDVAKAAIKEYRNASGPSWGTYLLVDAAARQSFSKLPLYDIDGQPNDPRHVRWTGEGSIGVQLQGGLSVEEALAGEDTQLRISPPPAACWDPSTGSRRARSRQSRESEVWLRIGSDGRKPIWCKFGVHMQRPLPPGATIMGAVAHCRRVGPHFDWYLTVTLRVDDASSLKPRVNATRDAVAVDVGWRVFGEGETYELRVGYWSDGSDAPPVVVRERDIRVPGFVIPPRGELRLDTATLNQLDAAGRRAVGARRPLRRRQGEIDRVAQNAAQERTRMGRPRRGRRDAARALQGAPRVALAGQDGRSDDQVGRVAQGAPRRRQMGVRHARCLAGARPVPVGRRVKVERPSAPAATGTVPPLRRGAG